VVTILTACYGLRNFCIFVVRKMFNAKRNYFSEEQKVLLLLLLLLGF
jgi:hypothetical protein